MPAQFLVKEIAGLRYNVGPKTHFYSTIFIYIKQKQNKKADSLKASILLPTRTKAGNFLIGCS